MSRADHTTGSEQRRSWPTLINRDPWLFCTFPTDDGTAAAVLRVVTTDGVVVVKSMVRGGEGVADPTPADLPARVRKWLDEDGYTIAREVPA